MDEKDLRVSDAEREQVGDALQRAVAEGRLTITEFTERMDVAMAARTRGELDVVLVDLPGPHRAPASRPAPDLAKRPPAGRAVPGGALVLRSVLGTATRKGVWTVPGVVTVRTVLATTTLDLTRAELTSDVLHVEVDDWLGTTTIVVPPGTAVDVDGLRSVGSTVTNGATLARSGVRLRVVVTGVVRLGTVTVRNSYGDKVRHFLG